MGNTFTGNTLIASNILVGNLLTNGLYTGIANTSPVHTLDVGSNLYVADTGSNVLFARGNIAASYFIGDGSRLSGIQTSAPTLQSVINVGNTFTGNTLIASNILVGNLLTNGLYTGISNLNPVHTLDVGSNLYISDTSVGGNVLSVRGNIFTNGAFQMSTLQSNGVIFVNSSNILSTDYASLSYNPALHILRVDDVGGGDFRLVTGNGIFKQTTTKGQAIYTEPNNGGEIHFQFADNGVVTYMPCIGLALSNYNTNDTGYIVTHGPVVGLITANVMVDTLQPGQAGDIGKIVYVSNVAGKLTITRPTNPANLVQNIGIILRVNGNGAGQTFDMQILGTGRYEDAPNFIQAARANVYQYVSIGGQMNTSANLYITGNAYISSNLSVTRLGIANTNPIHTLDVGSNLYVDVIGSNVLTVIGNIAANYLYGNAAYMTGVLQSIAPVPSNINRYYPVLSSVTNGTPSLYTADPNVYYQGSNLYISGTIKVLNTSKSLVESNIGLGMNQRYGIGADTNLQKLTLFTPDTEGYISFGQAKSDGTFTELANVNSLSTSVSNLVVSATTGAFTTLIANTINVNQSSTSYKTIKVLTSNGSSLRNINFTNTIEGAQTIINIYPLRTADLDIFASLSNTVGHVGTRTRVNFLSNIIINSASHAILACYTTDSNTFVSVSEYF